MDSRSAIIVSCIRYNRFSSEKPAQFLIDWMEMFFITARFINGSERAKSDSFQRFVFLVLPS